MTKKILVGISERLLLQIDLIAESRSQTRSELIRELLRNHVERWQRVSVPFVAPALSLVTSPPAQNNEQAGLSVATN